MAPTRKYFGEKFNLSKQDGLDGKTHVRFTWLDPDSSKQPFYIDVTSAGMTFHGESPLVCTEADLQDFAMLVSDAWQEHRKLAPKLHTSLSGH